MHKRRTDSEWIDPATLDPITKRALWLGIQQLDPALADLLQNDEMFSELKRAFSATVRFTRANAERYVRAGRQMIEEKKK